MTEQEMFDRVAAHLLKQGAKSVDDAGDCMYRGENGRMCAIGCLIPDDKYDPSMERNGIHSSPPVRDAVGIPAPAFSSKLFKLATKLQAIHDLDEVTGWPIALRNVAYAFGLSAAVLDHPGEVELTE